MAAGEGDASRPGLFRVNTLHGSVLANIVTGSGTGSVVHPSVCSSDKNTAVSPSISIAS